LAFCAPADALAVLAAGFLVWTSARPGKEWFPWPALYRRLVRRRHARLDKVATFGVVPVLEVALGVIVVLWLLPDIDKGFGWFAAFGALALLLLALTTAGEAVATTRALGRVALVLGALALASISELRPALVFGAVVSIVVVWALEPRPSLGARRVS
jgi:hypothetical protein